jgi:membrane protease YdiL (CAAX protease family)
MDPVGAGVLFLLVWYGVGCVTAHIVRVPVPDAVATPPAESAGVPLSVVWTVLWVVYEEILYRGYLIRRIGQVLRSEEMAVLASAVLFAATYANQGWNGVIHFGLGALLYGAVFAITGRLWPVVLAHGAHNLVAMLSH